MQIKSSVGLAVGPVDAIHWGQVLVLPHAYGILEIEDTQGRAQQEGVGILSQMGQLLSEPVVSLKAVEEIADRVACSVIQTLILLVPVGNVVYLVIRGKGVIYLKRGEELASLMHQDGAVSGEARDGDTFLLASNGFSAVLSHKELTGLFDHQPSSEIAEKLTLLLHEKTQGEGSVALVFGISELIENELEKEVLPVIPLRHHPWKLKTFLVVGLAFLFVVSVVLGMYKQTTVKKNQQVNIAISDGQHALEEGVALLELNPVKGRERLNEAKQVLEPLIHTVSTRSVDGRRLATLYQQVTDNLTQAMQVVQSPIALYYDVSLLKKGAVASNIARDGSSLVISDQVTNTVYQLNVLSKNAEIVGGGALLKSLSFVGMHGDSIYVVTPDGIIELRLGDKKTTLIVKKDEQWGTITSLVSFGGNLYLLDSQKSRIWKYVATEKDLPAGRQGFSETREYLNPDTLPDLTQTTGMAIDGSVWMGTSNGKILRFTQGKENTFVPKGVDPAFGTRLLVYTSDETKNIYVLDSQNNRIVVLDKEGTYLAQYRFTVTPALTGFVVFETQKKLLLLSDGKLYGIDLK